MASPTVINRTEYNMATAGTTILPTFVQTTGDLVVIFLALSVAGTISPDKSFVNLTNASSNFHILYKVLVGTEGGFVTCTITSSKGCSIAYNIQGFATSPTPEFSTVATATDLYPNPGSVTPTGGAKDYLWLAAFYQAGEEADDDTWCTSAPTTPAFTNLTQKTTTAAGTPATNCSVGSAQYASNAASMDPSTFTVVQSLVWRAYTVAVHPATLTYHDEAGTAAIATSTPTVALTVTRAVSGASAFASSTPAATMVVTRSISGTSGMASNLSTASLAITRPVSGAVAMETNVPAIYVAAGYIFYLTGTSDWRTAVNG